MAHPIEITEILTLILESAAPRPEYVEHCPPQHVILRERTRELYQFALVSRLWNTVATPLLWEILPHHLPLLKLLPDDAWSMTRPFGAAFRLSKDPAAANAFFNLPRLEALTVNRSLEQDDWQNIRPLAHYVKFMRYDGELCTSSTFSRMASSPPSEVLLPNLQRLQVTTKGVPTNSFLPFLLSPAIWDLQLKVLCEDMPDLSAIAARCPHLTHLLLSLPLLRSLDMRAAQKLGLEIIQYGSKHLTHLSLLIARLDEGGMLVSVLGYSPSLTSLRLFLSFPGTRAPYQQQTLTTTPQPLFVNLRLLHVNLMPPAFAQALIKSWGGPRPIESLSIALTHFDTIDDMANLIETIATHCSPSTLTRIHTLAGVSQEWTSIPWPFSYLRPLSGHRRLETVCIGETKGAPQFSDADYGELARWWPELVQLNVPNLTGSSCTLAALFHFADKCPRLQKLNLKLNALEIPYLGEKKLWGNSVLRELDINDGRIVLSLEVADCISGAFPQLSKLRYRFREELEFYNDDEAVTWKKKMWKEVEGYLAESRDVRERRASR
ncbi:hypothetical protein BD626DRAFT_458939 [Schizophyllum amplum]|uniref:F-box domain-containing protein n=1 Tax=Schizophyllum amplum TaxID=97359 RepID=A0A550CAX9_9AGAR|nr:hypothetical protein BD626DRAFT_458939 [Auriculariopsis ampla]